MLTWFNYEFCSNIPATRRFYSELVGLELVWDEPDSVAFVHGTIQIAFFESTELEEPYGWALQPGWGFGQVPIKETPQKRRSWSIALEPHQFREAVERMVESGVPTLWDEPTWVGYWSFVIKDPDGNTVELSDPVSAEDS